MTLSLYEEQIGKTGFVLEHDVSTALRKKKWTVISNKYYVDDNESTVREIDLIAYKSTAVKHIRVYTALILSCKKNESNAWALLSRDIDRADPNKNWQPLHAWSNDKALGYQLALPSFPTEYHQRAASTGPLDALAEPAYDIFAFQEMSRSTGAPQNDKAIFASITSLMKAQSYELNALPERKKVPCIYHFSLLSVVDSDLVRIRFLPAGPSASFVQSEHYVANYIIRMKEEAARIRFINASAFPGLIPDYDALHKFNCEYFLETHDAFYKDIVDDSKRLDVYLPEFQKAVSWQLHWRLYKTFNADVDTKKVDLYWDESRDSLAILTFMDQRYVDFLNSDTETKNTVSKALSKIYQYKGAFHFDNDIPF